MILNDKNGGVQMKNKRVLTILIILITILVAIATSVGIFSDEEKGLKEFTSVHGEKIELYGKGIYHNMSADVAVQGIAQDYLTLFAGIPLLLIGLYMTLKGSLKGKFFLAGVLSYLFVNYLFYSIMAMYNYLFPVYISLMGLTFFALSTTLFSFDMQALPGHFSKRTPNRLTGGFLIVNSLLIGMLWLQTVLTPLMDGTIIPPEVEHYTTLIVQGMDLGLLLPLSFVSGLFFLLKRKIGYLMAPVYIVFLSVQMAALVSKIIGMKMAGVAVGPSIVIIPTIMAIAICCAFLTLKSVKKRGETLR